MSQTDDCKHSDYKLCFKLKQHTPIIHFQADQHGATLRASELKPKLDRFLIDIFEKKNIDYQDFLINGQDGALGYKVRIMPDTSQKLSDNILLNYFGNQGNSKKKYPKQHNVAFNVKFFSFNQNLKEAIKDNFLEFLATHNFGTRQSKGYGSFYLDISDDEYQNIEEVLPKDTMYILCNTTDTRKIENTIKYFWQYLKSGINLNYGNGNCDRPYHSPFIREYLYNSDEANTWDKRWMKEVFFGLNPNSVQNYVFARALLGLSSTFVFKKTDEPCAARPTSLVINRDYQIEVSHEALQRIPSPVIFKPIFYENKTKIYLLLNQVLADNAIRTLGTNKFDFIIKLWDGQNTSPNIDKYDKKKYFIFQNEYDKNKDFFDNYWDLVNKGNNKIGIPKVFHLSPLRTMNINKLLTEFSKKFLQDFTLQINHRDSITFKVERSQS